MTKRTARPNSFNGEARTTAQTSAERAAIEQHLLDNPGHHTTAQIAAATGISEKIARARIATAVFDGQLVNRNPGTRPAMYQHIDHWRREQIVNRREPITNACMPNGSTSYWAKHMTAFNTPPRAA